MHDRQAQSGPFTDILGGIKRKEDAVEVCSLDAAAGVLDGDFECACVGLGKDREFAAIRHGLDGVDQEIDDDLSQVC